MTRRLVVGLGRHYAAVIDGTVHDTRDPCREGTRAVYGYWAAPCPPNETNPTRGAEL